MRGAQRRKRLRKESLGGEGWEESGCLPSSSVSASSPSNLFFGNQSFLGMTCPSDVLEIMGQKISALFCALWGQEGFWGAAFGARVGRR